MQPEKKLLHIQGRSPYYTNTFMIISPNGYAYVFDPAGDPEEYMRAAQENHCKIRAIIVTHGHFDHVYGLEELKELSGAPVYMSNLDCKGNKTFPVKNVDYNLQNNQRLFEDDICLQCISTPGHSAGSFIFLYDNFVFAGDTLFAGSIGRTDLEDGSYKVIMQSLRKIIDLNLKSEMYILPGHGEFSTMGRELKYNEFLIACQEQL